MIKSLPVYLIYKKWSRRNITKARNSDLQKEMKSIRDRKKR